MSTQKGRRRRSTCTNGHGAPSFENSSGSVYATLQGGTYASIAENCSNESGSAISQHRDDISTEKKKCDLDKIDGPSQRQMRHDSERALSDSNPKSGWQTVRKRRAQPKIPEKPNGELVGTERIKKRVFYVGGISLNCTADDLKSFCENKNCTVLDCRMLPSRRHGTFSARLVVVDSCAPALGDICWPKHIFIRPWSFDTDQFSRQRRGVAEESSF